VSLQWYDAAGHRTAVGARGVFTLRPVGNVAWRLSVTGHDGLETLHLPPGGRQFPSIADALQAAETINRLPAEGMMSGV
jgi:hypothetical protein